MTESLQTTWQEGYTFTALPGQATTTTGGASGSSHASGDATSYLNASGWQESDSSGAGYSNASGNSWSSGRTSQDHYDDQSSWSEPYNPAGTSSSGSSSSGTAVDHVWGGVTSSWSSGSWWTSQYTGSGSGSGGGSSSGSSIFTSGTGSSSYDLYVGYPGFYQGGGYPGLVRVLDSGWSWGVGWAGAGRNGPLGAAAFSGVGYVFTPGNPVAVVDPGLQSNHEGDHVNLTVHETDWASTGAGTFTAVGLPSGLNINPSNGLISGVIASGDALAGPYFVTATYTDALGNSNSTTFEWTVSDSLRVDYPGNQSGTEGNAVYLQTQAAGYGSGGAGGIYDATGLPNGLSIDPATGLISGTLAPGDADAGPYFVTVRYTNSAGDDAGTNFTWVVANPVTVADPGTQTVTEGDVVSLQLQGADANYSSLTYSAVNLPVGLTLNPSTGLISGTIAAGDAVAGDDHAGTYTATVSASDGGGSFAGQTVEWDVSPAVTLTDPSDQANTVGAVVSLQLQGTDAHGSSLTYSAAGLPAGLTINPFTGLISGTISATAGSSAVTVTATDGTYSGSQKFAWDVVAGPVSVTDPERQSGMEGQTVSLQITAHDPNATLLYTAVGLPDGLSINPTTGLIWGVIAAGDAATGPYFVTVTAFGADSANASQSFEWDISSPVTVTALSDQSSAEGATVNLSVGGADLYGGVPSFSAAGLPPGLSISSTGVISGVIAAGAAGPGPYSVTITATDGTYSGSQTFTWDVTAPAPPDSPPYVPPPFVPDAGPFTWNARDLALASFAQAGPNGFSDAADSLAEQDAVFNDLVWRPDEGGDTVPVIAPGGSRGQGRSSPKPPAFTPSPEAAWNLAIKPLVEQATEAHAMQWARDLHVTYVYGGLSWPQHSWSEVETVNGRPHLTVWANSGLSTADAATYIAREIENKYEKAGSPAVTLGGDLADVAATQALQKQAAAEEATLAHRPADVIESLVQEGKAFQQGDYVYVPTLAGKNLVLMVYRAYQPRGAADVADAEELGAGEAQRVQEEIDKNPLIFRNWLPDNPGRAAPTGSPFQLVKAWYNPLDNLGPNITVASLLALYQTPEKAKEYIEGAQSQEAADAWQATAEAVTFLYHALPFGAAWDSLAHGDYWEATLSLLGDVAFFAGGPLLKFAGEGTVLAKALVITSIAAEGTIGVTRAKDAYFAFQAGDNTKAAGYLGKAMMRLLGASVTAVSQLKTFTKLSSKAVTSAGELEKGVEEAEKVEAAAAKAAKEGEEALQAAETAAQKSPVKVLGGGGKIPFGATPLDVPVLRQPTSNTCVAASLDMLLEDYAPGRKFTSLESFEMTPKGLPIPAANAFIADNLSANGMKMVRGELDQALASGRPFIAFVDGGGEGLGHAVVVQEARTVAGVKSVVVRDPMVGAYLQPITDFDGSLIGHLEGMSYPCVWGKKNDAAFIGGVMNSKQVTKYLSLHGEGLLSSNEVAVGILYELLSEPELDLASLSSVGSLPVGVQEELLNLLRRIQVADYQWRPLLFSSGPYPDFPDFPGKLRKICDLLGV